MMVESWIGRLTQEGFRPSGRAASRADTIMVRESGPIRQAIWETVDRYEPDRARIAPRLERLTRILLAAGSLASAGSALVGPLGTLAHWLGALGAPILGLLPALL